MTKNRIITNDLALLKKNLLSAKKAESWLQRSFLKCKNIDFSKDLTEDQIDDLEAFTSRFARLIDILIHKVYRSLEISELETPKTLIDTINRMAKRNLVTSTEEIRIFKDLRNTISHDYDEEDLVALQRECLKKTPELLHYQNLVTEYCQRMGYF